MSEGPLPLRIKGVLGFLGLAVALYAGTAVQLVIDLAEGSLSWMAALRPLGVRILMILWVAKTGYGLIRRQPWARDSGLILFGLMLFGGLAGTMLSLMSETAARVGLSLPMKPWVYATLSAAVAIPLVLLFSWRPPKGPVAPR